MTKLEIIDTLKQGGYICQADGNRPTVYNYQGQAVTDCIPAIMERLSKQEGFTMWREEWGGRYVGPANRGKHDEHENHQRCKNIADTLAEYVAGSVHRCPDCGELFTIPEDAEKYRCPDCGFVGDVDEYEEQGLYDYFEDALDIEYRVDASRELRSVQIMVACGGPNIYIDTSSQNVELYWWGEKARYPMDSDTVAAVDAWAEEYWNL